MDIKNETIVDQYLQNILSSAKSLIVKHQLQATRLEQKYKKLVTVSLVLTSTSSFIITISDYFGPVFSNYGLVLSTTLMYLATFATTIIKFGNFEKLSLSHRATANKYYKLCESIAVQLTLDQTEDDVFVTNISTDMLKIFEDAPTLPELLVNSVDHKRNCLLLDNFIDRDRRNHKIDIMPE